MKRISLLLAVAALAGAQVYSPHILRKGQVDTRTPEAAGTTICERAGAKTPREKAEAIWRFFLTDGRFVAPGFWYHIAGWTYEEPKGEVLDAVKLLNSYGFGLCYHIAPLLEAVWEGAGLEARVWFLTGHTVAEVFYNGAWHHYDSDMMGYSTAGEGDPKQLPVASVLQIERDPRIILGKLLSPTRVDERRVEQPWYPADVQERAIGGLAELFSTAADNRVFPYTRYSLGHTMHFTLRPGERLIRYFRPEAPGLFYLPFKNEGGGKWSEFPQEIARYKIRTEDGPRSQKDARLWATGRIEYSPALGDDAAFHAKENLAAPAGSEAVLKPADPARRASAVFEITCPWVIIDAHVRLEGRVPEGGSLTVETSTDGGKHWDPAARSPHPNPGGAEFVPKVIARGEHGLLTAVSGKYAYLVRITMRGGAAVTAVKIQTRFQHNPRTLPAIERGENEFSFSTGDPFARREIPEPQAFRSANVRQVAEKGQTFITPAAAPGELMYEVSGTPALTGFDAGARFMDISSGEAPDKLTAEVRRTQASAPGRRRAASIEWSTSPDGPFRTLWKYSDDIDWKDGQAIDRVLRWPEVDRSVRDLPAGIRKVYVRYRFEKMALDDVRLASVGNARGRPAPVRITHVWREDGGERRHTETVAPGTRSRQYRIAAAGEIRNEAVIFECPKSW